MNLSNVSQIQSGIQTFTIDRVPDTEVKILQDLGDRLELNVLVREEEYHYEIDLELEAVSRPSRASLELPDRRCFTVVGNPYFDTVEVNQDSDKSSLPEYIYWSCFESEHGLPRILIAN